jgi:hypothetical protein
MKKQGRAFQCAPCREIIIFFRVTDASPYIALASIDRVVPNQQSHKMKRLREPIDVNRV